MGKRRIKLVDGARRSWRWFSVQAMALALALEATWQAIPGDLRASIDDVWRTAIVAALLIAGVVGRMIDQSDE